VSGPRPIFFLSDFGTEDAYVGVVEAVMASIAPAARVVHLAHGVPPQDLRRGAYQLFQAVPYLPGASVVLAVVDPGVGSERRAVAVTGERHLYVAPDNGLLTLAFAVDPPTSAVRIDNATYRLPSAGQTFHGRDVFGPAAACLSQGLDPAQLGPAVPLDDLVRLPLALAERDAGEVLTFDRFGNAITTLRTPPDAWAGVRVGERQIPRAGCYASVPVGAPLSLGGSAGLVEIAVRDGNARAQLGLAEAQAVQILR
jgi:S-adenosyl-L-methionine hydrolase (adenosine-forming)